jgi:hypothetical protein
VILLLSGSLLLPLNPKLIPRETKNNIPNMTKYLVVKPLSIFDCGLLIKITHWLVAFFLLLLFFILHKNFSLFFEIIYSSLLPYFFIFFFFI